MTATATAAESHPGASPMWQEMWAKGLPPRTAFDVGGPSQLLAEVIQKGPPLAARPGMTALVPGCGRSYDALALAEAGFDRVIAVDLAPTAVEAAKDFLKSTGSPAAQKIEVVCADFFKLQLEPVDVIWDCTFLCAIDPKARLDWASKMRELLKSDGTLLTCIFPVCEKEGGPPFAMSAPLVQSLLEPEFEALELNENVAQHMPGGSTLISTANGSKPKTMLGRWQPATKSG